MNGPNVLAWRIGAIIVIVEPLKKCPKSAWPMNCHKYLKTRANGEFFSALTPQTVLSPALLLLQVRLSVLGVVEHTTGLDWR